MSTFLLTFTIVFTLINCQKWKQPPAPDIKPKIEYLSRIRRIPRNQGQTESCWAFAMTGRLENALMIHSDSMSLSPWFITRKAYEEACIRAFNGKTDHISIRGMGHTFLSLAKKYGIVKQDDYPEQPDLALKPMLKELNNLLKQYKQRSDSICIFHNKVTQILDQYMGKIPDSINNNRSQKTDPVSFYHELTKELKPVIAATSFMDHPYNQYIPLNYPDNYEHRKFLNLSLDSLCKLTIQTIQKGGTAVWEGDITNNGFYWKEGLAIWHDKAVSPENRQNNYQKGQLDDNHTLLLMGIARDQNGQIYFVGQNSWGNRNRYRGYLFMSMDYFRMWTVAVFL